MATLFDLRCIEYCNTEKKSISYRSVIFNALRELRNSKFDFKVLVDLSHTSSSYILEELNTFLSDSSIVKYLVPNLGFEFTESEKQVLVISAIVSSECNLFISLDEKGESLKKTLESYIDIAVVDLDFFKGDFFLKIKEMDFESAKKYSSDHIIELEILQIKSILPFANVLMRKVFAFSLMRQKRRLLMFDVSNYFVKYSQTGIHRNVDAIWKYLPNLIKDEIEFCPVVFYNGQYRLWRKELGKNLGQIIVPVCGDVYFSADSNYSIQLENRKIFKKWHSCGVILCSYVYDLTFIFYPKTMYLEIAALLMRDWLDMLLLEYNGIFTESKTVRNEIIDYADKKLHKNTDLPYIGYAHLGCNALIDQNLIYDDDIKELKKYKGMIFIAVSTIEPRKNYPLLIKAFERATSQGMLNSKLVIVGSLGWKCDSIANLIKNSPLFGSSLIWYDDADDAKLAQLYSISDIYVSATMYEGFGLGICEAAHFGLPLLLSDIPINHELAEGYALFFKDENDLTLKILELAENPNKIMELKSATLSMKIQTWEDSARVFCSELSKFLSDNNQRKFRQCAS